MKLKKIILESFSKEKLTLFHGTTPENAKELVEKGWQPRKGSRGANFGQPDYLYLTTHPEDARWFSQQKGYDTVVKVKDVPVKYLKPDPEDEAGFSMEDLFNRMQNSKFPSKFVLTESLSSDHFEILD